MRKFLAAFLLCVFLLNLTGVFIAFKIQKSLIRNEIMQLLQHPGFEKELTVITVTSVNKGLIEWEHEKEFRYKGVMYDIVKKETNLKGELILHCIADKKETKLWSDLSEIVKKNNPSHQAIKNLVKLFSSVFISAEKNFINLSQNKSFVNISFTRHHLSPDDDVLSPPPRLG